jgi:enamine deaminase RidA (YjgF/YER057c/UK114 family)
LEGARVSLVDSIHWAPLGVELTMPLAATDDRVHRLTRPDDPINPGDGSTVLRRVSGPVADELYFLCRPACGTADVAEQAEAVYRAMLAVLASEGASLATVASETLYVGDARRDLEIILDTRRHVLEEAEPGPCRPPTAVVGQPPLGHGAGLELSALAVIPHRRQSRPATQVWSSPTCGCEACARVPARLVRVGEQTHAHAGNLYGAGEDAFEQTYAMFCAGEELLREAGMRFHQVVRTWIYLRDMDRDYADFNRARREFFRSRGIALLPASTAVGGEPAADAHDVCMRLHAVKSPEPLDVEVMSTPTLNEAWMYGSDFSRGLKTQDANKITLHVSGTASIDEAGRTVHAGDLAAQAERMLVNISSLLEAHGASFRDLVSAVAYLKNAGDAPLLRAIFHEHGFEGFPCTLVEAPICRPDLLCETEALAVLPLPGRARPW